MFRLFHKHDCAVEGHRWHTEHRRGYLRDRDLTGHDRDGRYHYRCVADDVEQERHICRDCGETDGWITTWSQCINSLTIPTDMHRELTKAGFVSR